MDLKNINIDDLKEKVLKLDKKTLIKFGIGFGALIVFLIIYLAILKPIVDKKKNIEKDQILKLNETKKFNKEIKLLKNKIKKITPKYKKNSSLFHSKAEVEDLYDSLSIFATNYNLIISKIEKKPPIPITSGKKGKKKKKKKKSAKAIKVSYYEIPVTYEISGNFLDFIKFKRAVAKSKKMLNFDEEVVKVEKEASGKIIATGQLTIVGLPNEFD
ncbi:pilus assembly protein PilO [Candidatus Pelagibacter sp.]|nr:pilus assembly protein PilO [Candidatus Pelagibacter sp.]